ITNSEPDGVLVRNLGAISFFKDSDLRLIGDFSLNVANPLTAKLLMESGGFENLTISYDLNEGQVGEMLAGTPADWLELTVHQHMPMFHMEHCVFCTFLSEGTSIKDCGKPCATYKVQLRDRVGQLHTLSADVGCRNTLFNGLAQTGVGSVEGFQKKGLRRFRLELLEEDEEEAQQLVQVYKRFFAKERTARDVASQLGAIERLGVTKGTLEQRREEVHR
ncbi:U32 family peptidase, partial [Akkermansiaceae bacterium]|nr:U32 family peptidase [Akkermansiaceae bacterium]